ncbi:hypothetical protein, partial [Actinomadura sp. HBU206391]|uniref:hypothetical protein n=1 Tax=Actinomadura sp. HBU206391 TaxID=2731692 RepID=UPI0021C78FAE
MFSNQRGQERDDRRIITVGVRCDPLHRVDGAHTNVALVRTELFDGSGETIGRPVLLGGAEGHRGSDQASRGEENSEQDADTVERLTPALPSPIHQLDALFDRKRVEFVLRRLRDPDRPQPPSEPPVLEIPIGGVADAVTPFEPVRNPHLAHGTDSCHLTIGSRPIVATPAI